MRPRLPLVGACALGAAVLAASPAAAATRETVLLTPGTPDAALFSGADRSGDRVFVSTLAALTPDDEDANVDLYELHDGSATLVSVTEPGSDASRSGGGQFRAISADGERIVFTTAEQLVPEDTDTWDDLYERSGGHTRLLSPSTDFFGFPLFFRGASADAERVFFITSESLVPEDTDGSDDVYGWFDDALHLMSVDSTGANFSAPAEYDGISTDGARVFFATAAAAAPGDTDSGRDVYERSGGATTLVTAAGAEDVAFKFVSGDGDHVFFETTERIDAADTDDEKDVYEATGGETRLVSIGPDGGNGPYRSDFQRAGRDGTRVYFTTSDRLVSADTDDSDDVYQRHAGETTIESVGPAGGNSGADLVVEGVNAAGTRLYFRTFEPLTVDDSDFAVDSYVREGGQTERVSIGAINDDDSGTDAGFAGATETGDRVFFTSLQRMAADDDDTSERDDIYEHANGETQLVSSGPEIEANTTRYDAVFESHSADGRRVWFTTYERLTADDQDDALDVYESRVPPEPPPPPPDEPGGSPEQPPGSGTEPITTPSATPLALATTLGKRLAERGGAVTIPCMARNGRLRSCAATIALSSISARSVVIGKGSRSFRGRGRRAALLRVRLTRRGIALVRRAGGASGVTVRLRARDVRGRSGALRRRATLVLPRAYVVSGYAPGESAVPRGARGALRDIARDLAGARAVRCIGHTDGSATRAFALRLGLLRATALCRALSARGVNARLTARTAGLAHPRASNATRRGRRLNRRVAVVVMG
ncbi:MAG TPA: hypothetical protein VF072_06375 [Thermoleophilaceae bacterium]